MEHYRILGRTRAFDGEFQVGETLTGSDSGFTINIVTTFDEQH